MKTALFRPLLLIAAAACGAGATTSAPDTSPASPAADPTVAEAGAALPGVDGGASEGRDGGGGHDAGTGSDDIALSFVFIGCNRISKGDWDPATNPSAANVPQLQQTLTDIAAMARTPKLVFFTGDLVLSLNKDTSLLAGQLDGWSQLYKAHPVSAKVDLVPMTGNHEMLYKNKSGIELSNPGADQVWTQWLTASGFGTKAGNGPTSAPPNADALQDDQSKLSYSFDVNGVHFVVLNTDTWTTTTGSSSATETGWVALHWLTADLAAAQANAQIGSIFVLGHKPVVNPNGSTLADDAINPTLTAGVAAALDGTPKVKAYLAAHAHEWDARKLTGPRGVYQVIAGNGGSALEADWAASPPYYGFSEARVYTSGRVGVVSYQRPVPTPYDSPTVVAATPVPELTIAP